jgi:hypothetical protein
LGSHPEHGLHCLGIDIVALVKAVVEADEHVSGARSGVGIALDLNAVSARSDMDPKPLLDRDQVPVIVTEQGAKQVGLLEFDLEPGAVGNCGKIASRHQAASFL